MKIKRFKDGPPPQVSVSTQNRWIRGEAAGVFRSPPRKKEEGNNAANLIDGEPNGVHVLAVAAVAAAVFLHQSHQHATGGLVVFRVVILLQERDLELRVDPKRVCRKASWVM